MATYRSKQALLVLALLFVSQGALFGEAIPTINEALVKKKAALLQEKFARRRHVRTIVYTAATGLFLYQGYQLLSSLLGAAPAQTNPTMPPAPKLSWGQWICAKETWIEGGKAIVMIGAGAATQRIFEHVYQMVCEPETISWFVHHHTYYLANIQNAYAYAQQLERLMGTEADQAYARTALVSTCCALMNDMQAIFSYMTYRHTRVNKKKAAEVLEIHRYLVHAVNEFAQVMQHVFTQNHFANLSFRINMLEVKLEREFARFARVEGSTWVDAAQIHDMIKRFSQ